MNSRTFFDDEPVPSIEKSASIAPWERDDLSDRRIARVVFPTGYDAVLDYLVPRELHDTLQSGVRVMVPLGRGNRSTLGYCIDVQDFHDTATDDIPARLKSILSLVDEQPLLNEKMLRLTRWIAAKYLCPLGQVLEAVLPAGVRSHAGTRLTTVLYVDKDSEHRLEVLKKTARLNDTGADPRTMNGGRSPRAQQGFLTPKQVHVLETLRRNVEPLTSSELQRAAKCSPAPIDALKRLGLIRMKTVRREQTNLIGGDERPLQVDPHQLNPDQKQALSLIHEAIRNRVYKTFLLHGVTGSGKTEVYIQAIVQAVQLGHQAIVLVPEISLTPQTVGRFRSRFPDVAVLHSHLTDAERHHQWTRIVRGEVQVVVGARSAVFAPLPRLGLIVIDEEHENSFKQDTAPRYHARDVARQRAEDESIPLILGSATPSLESWYATNRNTEGNNADFHLVSMPRRVRQLQLPLVEIVDLREEVRSQITRGAIHRQLHSAIRTALDEQGQVILLLNRRGFSTHIQCPACGEAVKCPNCDVALTHHRTEEIALCHYCDYQIPAPNRCPKCNFTGIRYGGFGTQKLEVEIKSRFPDAPVLRMDTDTMQGRGAHERAFDQFREGKVRILLGTQMIAKGLDFPNVTLVGVINADTSLHLPDFRASERTFHLITQVAGRTGRSERGGRVIVQTFCPDHPAILAAAGHDYRRFVASELPVRKLLGYPPFSWMVRIVVRGESETKTFDFAKGVVEDLRKESKNVPIKILGPAPAPFSKLRGLYRFHVHLHYTNALTLRDTVRSVTLRLKTPKDIQWIVDIDPIDML